MRNEEAAPPSQLSRAFRLTVSSYLLVPLTAIISGPLLAHALGPVGRGELAAVLAPLALANIIATFGFHEAATYFVARAEHSSVRIAWLAVGLSVLTGGLAAVALWFLAPLLLANAPRAVHPLQLLALSLPLSIGFAGARGVVAGTQQFGRVSLERAGASLGRLAVLGVAALTIGLTVSNAAVISVVVPIVFSLVLIAPLRGTATGGSEGLPASTFLTYSMHASIGTFGTILILQLDQALMVPLSSTAQLGFYAVAVSLAGLPAAAVQGVRDVVFSYSAVMASDPQLVARSSRVSVALCVPVVIIGAVLCKPVVPLLFGSDFAPAVLMSQVLLAAALPSTVTAVIGAGLMSAGRQRMRSMIMLGGAALTVVLVVLLVPRYGGEGAATASLLTYVVVALLCLVAYTRATGVSLRDCLVVRRSDLRRTAG